MADNKKLKSEIPAFIDLFKIILPTEDILLVTKTEDRGGLLLLTKSYGLVIEYTWGAQFINYGDDLGTRNLAYYNLSRLLLKDVTA